MLNNVLVYAKTDEDHLQGKRGTFQGLIGKLSEPRFIEGVRTNTGEIQAVLETLGKDGLAQKLYEATQKGWTDAFGFSIFAEGQKRLMDSGVTEAMVITKYHSFDLVTKPSAEGRVIEFLEGAPTEPNQPFTFPAQPPQTPPPANPPAQNNGQMDMAQFMEAQQQQIQSFYEQERNRNKAIIQIESSGLPATAIQRLTESVNQATNITPEYATKLIEVERGYINSLNPDAGKVQGMSWDNYRITESSYDKAKQQFIDLFDDDNKDVWSIRKAYVDLTGDHDVTGRVIASNAPIREAEGFTTATFANDVLGDGMHRKVLREYNNQTEMFAWRPLVDIVPFQDFRKKQNTRWGGYGDLHEVAEGEPYPEITSPTGEVVEYGISKKGGTTTVTLEMIANDDMGVIRKIASKLGRRAADKLSKYVFSFLSTNPTIYDGTPLFTSAHNNLSSLPLNEDNFYELYLKMKEQTEFNSEDKLNIPPAYLIVPLRLLKTARDIFKRDTNLDATHVQNISIQIIEASPFTDLTNWYLSTKPIDTPTIELGFYRNMQQPEFFVQDNPTSGSMFTNDVITYKIRHIYGAEIQDYRGLQASIVA